MKKNLLSLMLIGISTLSLASCSLGGNQNSEKVTGGIGEEVTEGAADYQVRVLTEKPADTASTADKVAYANSLTMEQLAEASEAEMEASNETFKVLGLTSALQKAATQLSKKYSWINYENANNADDKYAVTAASNVYVNNGYKDAALLTTVKGAKTAYVADYVLIQDARSIVDLAEEGIVHNYYPKDADTIGLAESNKALLEGIHFNKVFWTNTHFSEVSKKSLYNIWQMAGTSADKDHVKVSFQNPKTEQINMSFLVSVMAPSAQDRILKAYKNYYGKDWECDGTYATAGAQWVYEFINNVARWHDSDGSAMKKYQCQADEFAEDYVYFGAYSKMKDAAGTEYANLDLNGDGKIEGEKELKGNAIETVKWDWEIEGFNGFFYTMYSQVINNAKHPYTACLFARYILEPEFYSATMYSSSTPNADGSKGNQYGYYFPGTMPAYGTEGAKVTTNSYDWTKAKWQEKSLNENYSFLKGLKASTISGITAEVDKKLN